MCYNPWKFNIALEKWWLEDYFPIGKVTFQGQAVQLREGTPQIRPGGWFLSFLGVQQKVTQIFGIASNLGT